MNTPENEIAKEGIRAAVDSAKEFLGKLVGPPIEEVGELLSEQIKYYRFKNQIKILKKAQKILEKENINPQKVSLKNLIPLLDSGSIEEDEDMVNRWASLLATAANPKSIITMRPSFPEVLKELSPQEATILDKIFDMVVTLPIPREEWSHRGAVGSSIKKVCRLTDQEFEIAIDNLYRLRLCLPPSTSLEFIDNQHHRFQLHMKEIICLTDFGFAFVTACNNKT